MTNQPRRMRIRTQPPGVRAPVTNNNFETRELPFSVVVLDKLNGDMFYVNQQYIDFTGRVMNMGKNPEGTYIPRVRDRYVVHLPRVIQPGVDTGSIKVTTTTSPRPDVVIDLDFDANLDVIARQVLVNVMPTAGLPKDWPTQPVLDIHEIDARAI